MKRLIIVLTALLLTFSGCSIPTNEVTPTKLTSFFLNTVSSVTIYDMDKKEAEKIISDCFAYCKSLESLFSRTIETSEISQINNSNGNWISVSDDTIKLIYMAKEHSMISGGYFDCTIAPVSILWDFTSETPSIPSEVDLAEALSHVNWENIEIDGNSIRLLDPKASIDLGGIAKGFIGDMAKNFLIEKGVTKSIIDLGGNIVTINPDSTDTFNIGIQEPFGLQGEYLGILTVNNLSVVTSGIYERYFEKDGTIYHHLLDVKTGKPVDNTLSSVTIIAENSALADALSTTCFVLGLEKGRNLIEETSGVEGIFVDKNSNMFYTSGIGTEIDFQLPQ